MIPTTKFFGLAGSILWGEASGCLQCDFIDSMETAKRLRDCIHRK
jgi:hypothetical protein